MSANAPLSSSSAIQPRSTAWTDCGTLALSAQDVACMLANGLRLQDIADVLPEQDTGLLLQQAHRAARRGTDC